MTTKVRTTLTIARNLGLPAAETTTGTLVIYGGKGMGKTNLAAVLAEELAKAGQRFCILDPVGVSWGLRHAADGKGEGLTLLILGGVHGDLPIEPSGGTVVADFVADEEQDVLIDISRRADGRMWSHGEKIRFVTAYCTRLYERQGERRRPIMQLIDEAGRFVPQTMPKGSLDVPLCVGAIEQLVELGRNVGIGVTLITQRSARMAKSVSELAECMIAFRTVGPNSVSAILDWFGDHVEKSKWNALVEQLRSLPRGTALIVSPGWLNFEGVAEIRARETFDSSKTPTEVERKIAKRGKRPADLDKFRARMAETVEKAETLDPAKLRAKQDAERQAVTRELVDLRKQLATSTAALEQAKTALAAKTEKADRVVAKAANDALKATLVQYRRALEAAVKILVKVKAIDFDVDSAESLKALEQAVAAAVRQVTAPIEKRVATLVTRVEGVKLAAKHAEDLIHTLLEEKIDLTVQVQHREPYAVSLAAATNAPTIPKPAAPPRPAPTGPLAEDVRLSNANGLKKHVVALLTVLAQYGSRSRDQMLLLSGYSPSGDISTAFAGLLDHALIEPHAGDTLVITREGLEAVGPVAPMPTGSAFRDLMVAKGSSAERKILGAIFECYPTITSRADLLQRAGLKPSGDVSTAFGKFNRLGWIVERDGGIVAADAFFEA